MSLCRAGAKKTSRAGSLFLLAVLASSCLASCRARAQEFLLEWLPAETIHELSIDVAPNNDVYVVVSAFDFMNVFSPAGALLRQWPVQTAGPVGVAVTPSGDVYVSSGTSDRVERYDASGNLLGTVASQSTGFNNTGRMDVDPSGNLYVIDRGNDRVQKLTAAGLYLAQWPAEARDIAVGPHGDAYITDIGLQQVRHYDTSGNPLGTWSSPDPNDVPRGLGVDAQGNVYVLFNGIHGPPSAPVRIYDRFGKFLLAFGESGGDPGQIQFGVDLSVDPTSHEIYVLDSERGAVLKYSPFASVAVEEASWSAVKVLYQEP